MSYGLLGEGGAHAASDDASDSTSKPGSRSSDDAPPSISLMCGSAECGGTNDLSDRARTCRAAIDEVNRVGLVDFLQQDPRPAFALDLRVPDDARNLLRPVYCNPALQASEDGHLLNVISGKDNMDIPGAYSFRAYSKFRKWVFGQETDTKPAGFSYAEMQWTKVVVGGRWSIVSGVPDRPRSDFGFELSPAPSRADHSGLRTPSGAGFGSERERRPSFGGHQRTQSDDVVIMQPKTEWVEFPEEAVNRLSRFEGFNANLLNANTLDSADVSGLDWTSEHPFPNISDHIKFARSVDWGQTPLGPMKYWPAPLRMMANLIMRDPNPAVLFWGEECIMLYNEAYIELIGNVHPMAMGMSATIALKDYWDHFVPFVTRNKLSGEAVKEQDLPLFLQRRDILEETYFSFCFLPVTDEKGNLVGHYEPVAETTKTVVSERRMATLLKLSKKTSKAHNLDTFWRLVLQALASNDKDIPFALLYAVEDDEELSEPISTSTSCSSTNIVKQCVLKGSLGVPEGHPAAPPRLDFLQSIEGFMPYFREAMKSRRPTMLDLENSAVPPGLLDGIQWRGFGDRCKSLVICPITPTKSKNVLGFLITGLNPRRPYDEDYEQFMSVTSRLLATSLASVVLHEDEIRQREKMISQAELMKSQLVEQLDVSRREVERNEKKFQRFAERADVAIFIVGSDGYYNYRNKAWYEIFQLDEDELDIREAWPQLCYEEDLANCESYFAKLMMDKVPVVFELRLKRSWKPPSDDPGAFEDHAEHSIWILCSAYPELSDTGEVKEIVGCVTDISRQKWGEGLQKQRTDDALESKRQLENFIDTTSHEMRNPLSAIIQCADGIITSHSSHMSTTEDLKAAYRRLLETGIDAAQTIVQCSQHMKCIVDDVLTMSKLDSGLLVMTPVDAQPESIARHAVKMFEAEAKAADVGLDFSIEPSYRQLGLDWVSLDPTRLLQVLINLVTNAIKFTRLEAKRTITVNIGACKERPFRCDLGNVTYIRTATAAEAPSLAADWTKGETVFIQFTVQDTGRGLSTEERDLLFARFSQASPRTHIRYGGSGLGLFISRRLTEMQGGAIGFSSESRSGSTFSFYIKARVCTKPSTSSPLDARAAAGVRHTAADLMNAMMPSMTPNPTPPQSPVRARPPTADAATASSPLSEEIPSDSSSCRAEKQKPGPGRPCLQRKESSLSDPIHVLLVEDNLINQRVLANQLRSKGCVVSVANHGAEALDFLRKTTYYAATATTAAAAATNNNDHAHHSDNSATSSNASDDSTRQDPADRAGGGGGGGGGGDAPVALDVILMDWEMPVMDGLSAVREIRRMQREGVLRGHIPVIAVTANVRGEQINTAMEAGMDDVVSKPFRVPELCQRMRGLIEKLFC